MTFVFKRVVEGTIASSHNGYALRALVPEDETIVPSPSQKVHIFDLTRLNLPAGRYAIRVTSLSKDLEESPKSNAVYFGVE